MGSHYGGRYTGFCLEFATASAAFEKVMQVRYRNDFPSINLVPILQPEGDDPDCLVSQLFCTKSDSWKYEAEWRAIHAQTGTKFVYDSECLTGIFFGPDISQDSLKIICLILGGRNESVKFWRGRRSTTEFKVVFAHFVYTPTIEAKRRGLL
ncbi:DUF2971 domain-containing protein [Polaromonas sp.]|uniref:DUF2971 domain-containing protein n=1 Tax=Polaromonas sp. TaxID=1869339 RepID=UPI00345A34E9